MLGPPQLSSGPAGRRPRRLTLDNGLLIDAATTSGRRRTDAPSAATCHETPTAQHGVTAEMLPAGTPILFVPLNVEQQMTADAVAPGRGRVGAGPEGTAVAGGGEISALAP